MGKLSWGIISTGRIAGVFARGLEESKTGKLLAAGSRSQESADRFGSEFNVPRCYSSYEALLEDKDVQAVYIATPHPVHSEWAVKAAEAGKHILCEKPIALNYPETMAMIEAARRNDVFLMEAFMYRCNPMVEKLVELLRERAIGDVRIIQATFSFHAGFNPESRLFNNALGGGGVLDVGCYTTSIARLIAGAALGRELAEPLEIRAMGHLGETGVDEYAVATARFENDILARLYTGVTLNQENVVRIYGTEGSIFIPAPWFWRPAKIVVSNQSRTYEVTGEEVNNYALEADVVARDLDNRQARYPAMSWSDTLGNLRMMDMWRSTMGMRYDIEKPDANFPTIDRRPLTVRPGGNMKYGRVEGVDKPVSRVVMGAVLGSVEFPLPHTSMMFDEFFRYGGNTFDTAYVYGNADARVGQWVKNRGVRDDVVILAKGAHTPFCNPDDLTSQLLESLENLQTDYVDIYLMHRDNPEIPVGEFVDVLNEHRNAGRIRAFGGSNWTPERVAAANDYAKSKGLTGFSAVSNNFSLARMVEAPWDGCIASSDAESRAWFEKSGIPLMAWSSLGRAFFARGDRDNRHDADLVRCWYCEDNFQRLERAKELAEERGVLPVQIALAYVLNQSFPTFALIGPGNLDELRVSIEGLDIMLTPAELRWLNQED